MKINAYEFVAVLIVGAAIIFAGYIEFGLEHHNVEPMMYEENVEPMEDLGYQSGLTEGWGVEGNGMYLYDMKQ